MILPAHKLIQWPQCILLIDKNKGKKLLLNLVEKLSEVEALFINLYRIELLNKKKRSFNYMVFLNI